MPPKEKCRRNQPPSRPCIESYSIPIRVRRQTSSYEYMPEDEPAQPPCICSQEDVFEDTPEVINCTGVSPSDCCIDENEPVQSADEEEDPGSWEILICRRPVVQTPSLCDTCSENAIRVALRKTKLQKSCAVCSKPIDTPTKSAAGSQCTLRSTPPPCPPPQCPPPQRSCEVCGAHTPACPEPARIPPAPKPVEICDACSQTRESSGTALRKDQQSQTKQAVVDSFAGCCTVERKESVKDETPECKTCEKPVVNKTCKTRNEPNGPMSQKLGQSTPDKLKNLPDANYGNQTQSKNKNPVCTCHFPPAFSKFGCTGHITGFCDCKK